MDNSTWGALLVAWLLLAPMIGVAVSSRWGGATTAAGVGVGRHRMADDNANIPPERVDYAQTSGDRSIQRDAMRDRDFRDQPRH
jgi:hypothetical protein